MVNIGESGRGKRGGVRLGYFSEIGSHGVMLLMIKYIL